MTRITPAIKSILSPLQGISPFWSRFLARGMPGKIEKQIGQWCKQSQKAHKPIRQNPPYFWLPGINWEHITTQYPSATTQPLIGLRFPCHSHPVDFAFEHFQQSVAARFMEIRRAYLRFMILNFLLNATASRLPHLRQARTFGLPPFVNAKSLRAATFSATIAAH